MTRYAAHAVRSLDAGTVSAPEPTEEFACPSAP
ncbi:hypothetical protein HEB94_008363 [Actinopolymorpha pittospori]|uniref:Uncharacterized protein n=1 Tax=Actinopolymorpha pittospori TaxID=648752 RepID=A0A927NAY3_9ACTN|nr:hypothetical protein [Actinopolymorpha pittospori]